jgi:hypothetical protein
VGGGSPGGIAGIGHGDRPHPTWRLRRRQIRQRTPRQKAEWPLGAADMAARPKYRDQTRLPVGKFDHDLITCRVRLEPVEHFGC